MNKRGLFLLAIISILFLSLVSAQTAGIQDNLDKLEDKANQLEDTINTLSDTESRTEFLKEKWADFLADTPFGKATETTSSVLKSPVFSVLFDLIFGMSFDWVWAFWINFALWLVLFAWFRKRFAPVLLGIKMKMFSPGKHTLFAFVITSIFGAINLIPFFSNNISKLILKIPSLFIQIVINIFVVVLIIWWAISINYPHQKMRDAEQDYELKKLEKKTNMPTKESEKDVKSAWEFLSEFGKQLRDISKE